MFLGTKVFRSAPVQSYRTVACFPSSNGHCLKTQTSLNRIPRAPRTPRTALCQTLEMAGSESLSIAPMMEYTDVYFRSFVRLLTKRTWLYTEMIVDSTLRYNEDSDRFLWFPREQHPIACQLGGSTPDFLSEASRVVAGYNYDEINLNCGCPSDRVAGAGCFGAALMLQPDLVASCVRAVSETVDIPVTIKCRLGVDDIDSYEDVSRFVRVVSEGSDVTHFIIHARKCLLNGLSPHQNRTIPPLKHEWVFALKRDFPNLEFSLNGGVCSSDEAFNILRHQLEDGSRVRSVMIGRAAYDKPWQALSTVDRRIFGEEANPAQNRRQVLQDYARCCEEIEKKWIADERKRPSLRTMLKPVLNLFHGEKHGRKWKSLLDQELKTATSLTELFDKTLGILPEEVLDRPPNDEHSNDTRAFATGPLPRIAL